MQNLVHSRVKFYAVFTVLDLLLANRLGVLLKDDGECILIGADDNLALEELKDGGGNIGGYGTEERLFKNFCLTLTHCEKENLISVHNLTNAHGKCPGGNILTLCKEASVCIDGRVGEVNKACALGEGNIGLIEADVTVITDTENLHVNAAHGCDNCIVSCALCLGISGKTVGEIGVLFLNINVVEEIVMHKVGVALVVVGGKSNVLVEVYALYIGEGNLALVVSCDKLGIHTDGRRAGCKTENGVLLALKNSGDYIRTVNTCIICSLTINNLDHLYLSFIFKNTFLRLHASRQGGIPYPKQA